MKERTRQCSLRVSYVNLAMVATSHLQPCADYFNSSLMIQNFTLSNVTNGNYHVIFYDERPPTCT